MGQVLGFAHCKEAPSTASTTPDSTEGGSEEFPELSPLEPPEEEEEDDEDEDRAWGAGRPPRDPPRELTFSYIAFRGGCGPPQTEPGPPRSRREPRRGRPLPPRPGSGGSPRVGAGQDPPRGRAPPPPKPPGEPPVTPGGGLGAELGGLKAEEPPRIVAAPAPLPAPPPGGAPRAPPPGPPQGSVPPPNQSESAAGADGQVWELLYWRVPERSALALLVALVAVGCLSRFSAISVGAYGALAVLAVTVPLRLRQMALRALGTAPPEPPARAQAEVPAVLSPGLLSPAGLSPEQQQRWARSLARHVVTAARTLTRLFLVHSVPESLKFAFFFYLLTYVGAACNGLTLLGAGVICAFTFPVLYRRHQAHIDQYMSLVRSHLSHLRARVLAKLPSAKVKPQ